MAVPNATVIPTQYLNTAMMWQYLTPQLCLTIPEYRSDMAVSHATVIPDNTSIPEYRSGVVVPDAAVARLPEA